VWRADSCRNSRLQTLLWISEGTLGIEAMKETGGVLTVKTGRGECGQVLISVSDCHAALKSRKMDCEA